MDMSSFDDIDNRRRRAPQNTANYPDSHDDELEIEELDADSEAGEARINNSEGISREMMQGGSDGDEAQLDPVRYIATDIGQIYPLTNSSPVRHGSDGDDDEPTGQRNRVHFERRVHRGSRSPSLDSQALGDYENQERYESTGDYDPSLSNDDVENARHIFRSRLQASRRDEDWEPRSRRTLEHIKQQGLQKMYSFLDSPAFDSDAPSHMRNAPLDRTWDAFAKNWDNGTVTLRIIQSSEYTADKSNTQNIRLVCSNGAGALTMPSETKGTKWIHLESNNLTLEHLKTLLMRLDFLLSPTLRRLALHSIEDIRQADPLKVKALGGTRPKPGDVLGQLSAFSGSKTRGPDSTIFVSSPHLFAPTLDDNLPLKGVPTLLDSLYESHIDNTIGGHSPSAQAGSFLVPQFWSLLLNSDFLITCSHLPFEKLCEGLVEMDMTTSTADSRLTVTISDLSQRTFTIAVHPSSTYADFLNDVLEMGTPKQGSDDVYELHGSNGSPLRPQQWVQLLQSRKLEGQMFQIRIKPADPISDDTFSVNDIWDQPSVHQSGTSYRLRMMERERSALRYTNDVLELVQSNYFKHKTVEQVRDESEPQQTETTAEDEYCLEREPKESGPNIFNIDQSSDDEKEDDKRVEEDKLSEEFDPPRRSNSIPVNRHSFRSIPWDYERQRPESIRSSSFDSQRIPKKPQRASSMAETSMLPVDKVSISVMREMGYDFTIEDDMYIFAFPVDMESIHQLLNIRADKIPNRIIKKPFFTWKSMTSVSHTGNTTDATKVLNRVLRLLLKDRTSQLHQTGFTCSLADLLERHVLSEDVADGSVSSAKGKDRVSARETAAEPSVTPSRGSAADMSTLNNDSAMEKAADSADESSPDSFRDSTSHSSQDNTFNVRRERLIEVTNLLLEDFVPVRSSASTHRLVQSLWGYVDTILRQLAAAPIRSQQPKRWIIRKFPFGDGELTFEDCKDCSSKTRYSGCAPALDHLHSQHMKCAPEREFKIPSEDPCFIWLSCTDEIPPVHAGDRVAIGIDNLINNVLEITARTHGLHCLVVPSTPTKRKALPLLADLVYLFQDTLSMYAIVARELTYIVRADIQYPNGGRCSQVASNLQRYRDKIMDNIRRLLVTAEAEILLGSKTRQFDFVEAISSEFLVAALGIHLQNKPVDQDSPETSELYRQRLWQLRYQGARRPDRRLHFNLNKFVNEVSALRALGRAQARALTQYRQFISPRSRPITVQNRKVNYRFEKLLINRQLRQLEDRAEDLDNLSREARRLKDEVRANIEILEEGHGKAIRVFTLVTLFFLPLSFVTSFLGMNTADIRDMDNDQRLFWAIGIPVTVVVFTLAFVYGYQSDALFDAIAAALEARQARRAAKLKRRPTREDTMYSIRSLRSDGRNLSGATKGFRLWKRRGKKDTNLAAV